MLAVMLAFESHAWCAAGWKLVLKDGSVIECTGAPLIINDVYMFRQINGQDGSLAADRVDKEKTDQANKVVPDRRQWRPAGGSAKEPDSAPSGSADILTLRDADFDSQVLKSETPVLVEFWATWCGYCKIFEPTVKAVASEYAGRMRVGKLDIDKNPATADRYHVDGTPTVLLFKQGRVVGTVEGAADKAEVVQMIRAGL